MIRNMLIGQSGGPTVAINASLSGAIKRGMSSDQIGAVYGTKAGIEGILNDNIIPLEPYLTSEMDFSLLEHTPAMALGSCRYKLPDLSQDREVYEKVLSIFHKYNIGYFFYIGGNDSMDTVKKLSAYFQEIGEDIKVVGIPKTIDNDLACTDHTPGFGSAAKYVATSMLEITRDSNVYDMESITIVEIMGRNAGWLTASSVLARLGGTSAPHLIYLPEAPFDTEQFVRDFKGFTGKVQNLIIAVSEGIRFADGSYVAEANAKTDVFGHKYLSGVGKVLENIVRERSDCKVRSVELNVLQRCAVHIGAETDIQEASKVGEAAVNFALRGKTGIMAVMNRVSNRPYLIEYGYRDVNEIANVEKKVPREWINKDGNDVTEEMVEYLRPLILGEAKQYMENGLPKHFTFAPIESYGMEKE
jgi:6-phosphofructokinase